MQGHSGKMGSLIYEKLSKEHDFIKLYDSNEVFDGNLPLADAVIDFSSPVSAYELAKQSLLAHIPFISGTTGLTRKMIEELSTIAANTETGAYIVSNFDESIEILCDCLKKFDSKDNQILLTEHHHWSKKDCPSGTALSLAEAFKISHVSFTSIRSKRYQYKHVIQIVSKERKIVFEHSVTDKKVYIEGVTKALSQVMSFVGLRTRLS